MRGPIDLRWDAGVYYILGTSLAEGRGYRLLNEPGEPQAVQYPPLLPLLIAGQQRLLGTSDPVVVGKWLKLTYQLMLMGCAALTYLLARRWVSRWPAFLAAVMFLLSLNTYFMGGLAYAEMPFALASLMFFIPHRSTRTANAFSGACAITAYLLRTIGITLLVTWIADAAVSARWKTVITRSVVAMIPLMLWQGYVHRVQASSDYQHPAYTYQRAAYQFYNVSYSRNVAYVDPFRPELGLITRGQLVRRIFDNVLWERRSLPETVTTSLEFWDRMHSWIGPRLPIRVFRLFEAAFSYSVALLMVAGLISMTLQGELLIPFYVAVSALAIAATPWLFHFSRYFWPLSPILAVAFMLGVKVARTSVDSTGFSICRQSGWALLCLLVGAAISVESAVWVFNCVRPDLRDATYVDAHNRVHTYRVLYFDQRYQNFDRAVDWIKQKAGPHAVVATSCPHYLYLRSGRKTVIPPYESNLDRIQLLLDSVPASYLIADDLGLMEHVASKVVDNVTRRYPRQWKIATITLDPKIVVYRRINSVPPVHSPYASSSIPRYR
jgi:hypothetical protein